MNPFDKLRGEFVAYIDKQFELIERKLEAAILRRLAKSLSDMADGEK